MSLNENRKKIIVTVGPSSYSESVIRKMDEAGVDIFRINISHTKIADLPGIIEDLMSWTSKTVCLDTEGAQLRTGEIEGGGIEVTSNEVINFVRRDFDGGIPLSLDEAFSLLKPGDILKIDFNNVVVQVLETGNIIKARVLSGGEVKSNKGIAIDRDVEFPPFTEKDVKAFGIAKMFKLDTFALSFTSSGDTVEAMRRFFPYDVNVISKVESRIGLEHIKSICEKADAILIDRGDLSRDIPLERIITAQKYIIKTASEAKRDVYVATNLMESMIANSKPTRAEIHDIIATLESGASGLVLAAETAIGCYPVECVRVMKRVMDDNSESGGVIDMECLFTPPADRLVEPHGGKLVQQHFLGDSLPLDKLPFLDVDDEVVSDVVQICEGTYSPLTSFMNVRTLKSVLYEYKLPIGVPWTLPVIMQIDRRTAGLIPHNGELILRYCGEIFAVLNIDGVEKVSNMNEIAKEWFGTLDLSHPGVSKFFAKGEYIVSAKPFLIKRPLSEFTSSYELLPRQTRSLFNEYGWHKVVGFHTRNVPHRGHEYIQHKALEMSNSDAIFISPVVGKKKKGDFSAYAIIRCYEELIKLGVYEPYGALLGTFNTYSRYSGPREAVFTAICRKNYGCSSFIVGRDHTGVGNFYEPDASLKIFDKVDIGIDIYGFDTVYYCSKCGSYASECRHDISFRKNLSGTFVRRSLENGISISSYLMRDELFCILRGMYKDNKAGLFICR